FSRTSLDRLLHQFGMSSQGGGQITIAASAQADYPAVWACYRRSQSSLRSRYDKDLAEAIRSYIAASRSMMEELDQRITAQLTTGSKVILWGPGALASKLLLQTSLKGMQVTACVDSNRASHGKQFAGVRVTGPEEIGNSGASEPIVICSLLHDR